MNRNNREESRTKEVKEENCLRNVKKIKQIVINYCFLFFITV